MDYKLLFIILAVLFLLILVYWEIRTLKDNYKLETERTIIGIDKNNNNMMLRLQHNITECVKNVKNISNNTLQKIKKITYNNNQPIKKFINHYTETADSDGGSSNMEYSNKHKEIYYMSSDKDSYDENEKEEEEIDNIDNIENGYNDVVDINDRIEYIIEEKRSLRLKEIEEEENDDNIPTWNSKEMTISNDSHIPIIESDTNRQQLINDGVNDEDADVDANNEDVDVGANNEDINDKDINDEDINDEDVNDSTNDENVNDSVNDEDVNDSTNDEDVNDSVTDEDVNDEDVNDEDVNDSVTDEDVNNGDIDSIKDDINEDNDSDSDDNKLKPVTEYTLIELKKMTKEYKLKLSYLKDKKRKYYKKQELYNNLKDKFF